MTWYMYNVHVTTIFKVAQTLYMCIFVLKLYFCILINTVSVYFCELNVIYCLSVLVLSWYNTKRL